MFFRVNFVVMFIGVMDATWGRELSEESATEETLAEQWLQEINGNLDNDIGYNAQKAVWDYFTNMTKENGVLQVDSNV